VLLYAGRPNWALLPTVHPPEIRWGTFGPGASGVMDLSWLVRGEAFTQGGSRD
jgi:hypothetical protein